MSSAAGIALPEVRQVPGTGAEIRSELRRVHAESVPYWATYIGPDFFIRPTAEVWAAADHVRHLTKSLRAIASGLELPRLLLALRFGIARRPSRRYEVLRADYEGALRGGAKAGAFAPRPLATVEQNDEGRVKVMFQHAAAVDRLCIALETWSERALDRLRMRHPTLGMLTAREMALFALMHNVHHVHVAERRRGQAHVR